MKNKGSLNRNPDSLENKLLHIHSLGRITIHNMAQGDINKLEHEGYITQVFIGNWALTEKGKKVIGVK